jgi:hypothetical protein
MYFVFKKVRQVNAETVANSFIQGAVEVPQVESEEVPDVEEVAIVKQLHSTIVLKQAPVDEKEKEEKEPTKEVKQISDKGKKKSSSGDSSSSSDSSSDSDTSSSSSDSSSDSDTSSSSAPARKFKASPVKPPVIIVQPIVEPKENPLQEKPKRKYTKKAVALAVEVAPQQVKPKRAYTKKAQPAALVQPVEVKPTAEVKPKRKYTKKGNDV